MIDRESMYWLWLARANRILAALSLPLLSACPPAQPPLYESACAAACARGRELACEWSAQTPEGASCETVCETTEATGYTTMHPQCVALATTCGEAERYSRNGC